MSACLFVFVGGVGLTITIFILYRLAKSKNISAHKHATILSLGVGTTWLVAPLASFLAPEVRLPDKGFILFWLIISVIVSVFLYGIDRFVYEMVERSKRKRF